MRKLNLKIEAIQISIYCNIVQKVLTNHMELSINKVLVFSYLLKKQRYYIANIYNGNNKEDILNKCLSLLSGNYQDYCDNVPFIIKSIYLLDINKIITVENDNLKILDHSNSFTMKIDTYKESKFMFKAIEESKKISDRQFLKEVIDYV